MYTCPLIVFMYACEYEYTPAIEIYQCGKNKKEGRGMVKSHTKTFMYDK